MTKRSKTTSILAATVSFIAYKVTKVSIKIRTHRLLKLLNIIRLSKSIYLRRILAPEIEQNVSIIANERKDFELKSNLKSTLQRKTVLSSSIILKEPRANEKGIIFIATEGDFIKLISTGDLGCVFNKYLCVLASAWSPPDFRKYAEVIGKSSDPLFVVISNWEDMDYFSFLHPWVQPVPILTCDWLNPSLFFPRPADDRDIDIIMVAGWGKYKRHWLLFKALRDMSPQLRVVLIGADSQGRTVDDVKKEAHVFRIKQHVDFMTNLPVHEVNMLQGQSKIAAQLSIREGACVAVTEAFMANTPVCMMEDAHVGSKRHINKETGILLTYSFLGRQLSNFLSSYASFKPREWALREISYSRSCLMLNNILKIYSLNRGQKWQKDIAPFYWDYFKANYALESDKVGLKEEIIKFDKLHNISVGGLEFS